MSAQVKIRDAPCPVGKPLRVLLVEDSEDDAKLALRALRRGGFEPTHRRVQTAAELEGALARERWDAVISDFRMPGFSGIDALRIFRSTGLDIPFILISGTIGESTAVDAMKAGASDYIMKESLARLAPALERELKEARTRATHRHDLRRSESLKGAIIKSSLDCIVTIDHEGRIVEFNPAAEATFGRTRETVLGKDMTELIVPPRLRDAHRRGFARFLATGEGPILGKRRELEAVRADGTEFPIELAITSIGAASTPMFTAFIRDITQRKEADKKIKRLNRVYAVLSGINTLIVRVRDRDELFREACQIAVNQGGFPMAWIGMADHDAGVVKPMASAGDVRGFLASARLGMDADMPDAAGLAGQAMRAKRPMISNDIQGDPGRLNKKEMAERGINSVAVLPLIVGGKAIGLLGLYAADSGFFDDDEMRLLAELAGDIAFAIDHIGKQERTDYLAYYDALTGLANRALFHERLDQHAITAREQGRKIALVLLDIERFKTINDTLGRQAGDALLKEVGARLSQSAAGRVARIDVDHFAIVVTEVRSEEELARLIEQRYGEIFGPSFRIGESELRLSAKFGVAMFPADGANADTLFRNAEAALKNAKARGDRYLFYAQAMNERVAEKLSLEFRLRQALDNGEFVLHYQPKVDLANGKVTGAEALIRWNDPKAGLVSPGKFIPILEETGLIHEVGRWALRQALADYLRWRAAGLPVERIAVNVSPLQLRDRNFIAEIQQIVSVDAAAALGLELEITESMIMADVGQSIASLKAIRALGVTVAIDDFGTGFSSLGYLSKLPVDTLKIDRSFVVDMTEGPQGLALVSTIIGLAHSLKLKVVAEGVETDEQSRLLRLLNCDEMQGYLFSKPVPSEIFETRFLAPLAAGEHAEPRAA